MPPPPLPPLPSPPDALNHGIAARFWTRSRQTKGPSLCRRSARALHPAVATRAHTPTPRSHLPTPRLGHSESAYPLPLFYSGRCWLIHTVRKLRDESPPAVSEVPLPDARRVAAFLSRASPGPASGIPVDEVADLFLEAPGEAAAAAGLPRDALDGVSGLGPIGRLGPAVAKLNAALADAFTPVAQV